MRLKQVFTVVVLILVNILFLFTQGEVRLEKMDKKITKWSNQVSFEVTDTFEENVGILKLQSLFNETWWQTISRNVSDLLENISIAIEKKLQEAVGILITNKMLIESLRRTDPEMSNGTAEVNCCDSGYETKYDTARFKTEVNSSFACAIQPLASGNSYLTSSLEMAYKRNTKRSNAIKLQYFGSSSGSYHQYPASINVCSKSDTFNPRLRSWYVGAAMSLRKNMIIIIDKSGSMKEKGRMSLAIDAALTVLDTLRPDDYVTAIAFSSSVIFPHGCFSKSLAKATASNLKSLKDWITSLSYGGRTKYSLAFKEAFKVFEHFTIGSIKKGKDIMLFLTDGVPNDKPNEEIYPTTINGQKKMNNSVTILVYGLGTGIQGNNKAKNILRKISQMNGGEFTIIEDGSAEKLKEVFGSYYKHFMSTNGNLAFGRPAMQSSLKSKYLPNYAVDGLENSTCARTTIENDPWWSVELENDNYINAVTVTNCCKEIIENVDIVVVHKDRNSQKKCGFINELKDNQSITVLCPSDVFGRYVTVRIAGKNKSLSICEVQVYKNQAPSSTFSMPCKRENGTMFGVAAIDLSLSEIFSEVLSFSYGQFSYGALIDIEGRVWIHPRSPPPESKFGPSLLPLQVFESWLNQTIMQRILSEPKGQIYSKKVLIQKKRGYSNTEGMETKEVNATVHWKRIRNMFILILVMVGNDIDNKLFISDTKFELSGNNETGWNVSIKQIKSTVKTTKDERHFLTGVEADAIIAGYLSSTWKQTRNKTSIGVMWRYIGTQSGIYRIYPGVTLTQNINHKKYPWFTRAATTSRQIALSYPFDDPFGRGKIISVSKAVIKQRYINQNYSQPELIAVTGMDMTISSFRRMVLNVMPGCLDDYDCFFIDQSGYLFLKFNEENDVAHVTETFSWLGKQFVEDLKILKPHWCNDFLDFKVHLYYKTVITKKIISNATNVCRQYIILPLKNVSASILALPSRRIYGHCQDKLPTNAKEGCNCSKTCHTCSYQFRKCQCPCTCIMSFDRCNNSILNLFTRITCPVPNVNTSLIKSCESEKSPRCDKSCNSALNKQQCDEIAQCFWCENSFYESCETFCPFNLSQRIVVKFKTDLNLLIPDLNEKIKSEIVKGLQKTLYNILGEKLENELHNTTFQEGSITLTIQGSVKSDIHIKVRDIRRAFEAGNFYISAPNNGSTKKIYPVEINVFDVNECAERLDDCHENAYCEDIKNSYNCTCINGFYGNGKNCTDINECQQNVNICHVNSTCFNFPGSYKCSCRTGFTGNGTTCKDINECDHPPCHSNATCKNFIGSFQCSCNVGFVGSGFNCSDINECRQENVCYVNSTCINVFGSHKCECRTGFTGNGTTCKDINECDHTPCHSNGTCKNFIGSFQCSCNVGFIGSGFNCSDINECQQNVCHVNATCINVPGSYKCTCHTGFTGNGTTCKDINECDYSPCHSNATCKNSAGSFQCSCNVGFVGSGFNCSDINECRQENVCHVNSNCINVFGSHKCECRTGFTGNGTTCKDINECDHTPCHSNGTCKNFIGSFQCSCNVGFIGSGFNCSDINECQQNVCHVNATCTDVPGSYKCTCRTGFTGNGTTCKDINECQQNVCHVNSTCINVPGSYKCICRTGFSGNGATCKEINGCDHSPCHSNATCKNSVGSFQCFCNVGFIGSGLNCSEILHGQTTDEPLFTTVLNQSGANEQPSIVIITLVITSFIIGTTGGFLCIFFILTRRKRRKTKVVPKQDHTKIEVWPVNDNQNNFQMTEGGNVCNRTQKWS